MMNSGREALFITRYSSLVIHHSLLITRYSSLVTHHSSFIIHHSLLTTLLAISIAPINPTLGFMMMSTGIVSSSDANLPLRVNASTNLPFVKWRVFFPATPPARETPPRDRRRSAMLPASAP